jgi:hypothetical protein
MDYKKIGSHFEADMVKDNLLSIIAGLGDITISFFTGLPQGYLSVIDNMYKSISSFRDHALMEKVIYFLDEGSTATVEEREDLIKKFDADKSFEQKFSLFTLVALDRLDFPQKATFISRILKAYQQGTINKLTVVRYKSIVENLELEDLMRLRNSYGYEGYPRDRSHPSLFKFQTFGLVRIRAGLEMRGGYNPTDLRYDESAVQVELTKFGSEFIKVICKTGSNEYEDDHLL